MGKQEFNINNGRIFTKYVRKLVRCGFSECAARKTLGGLLEDDMKSIVKMHEEKIEYL